MLKENPLQVFAPTIYAGMIAIILTVLWRNFFGINIYAVIGFVFIGAVVSAVSFPDHAELKNSTFLGKVAHLVIFQYTLFFLLCLCAAIIAIPFFTLQNFLS